MSKISFEGIGESVATFACTGQAANGQVVKMSANGTVAPCSAGDRFCGVALTPAGGYAAVQVGGFAAVNCTDTGVKVGYAALTADGSGGVKAAGEEDSAGTYLVVSVDSTAGTAVVLL